MNKNILINVAMLATGAAIGSLVTWRLLKTKYEQIANEEIESVIETFSKRESEETTEVVEEEEPDFKKQLNSKPSITEYASVIQEQNYTNYNDAQPKKEANDMDKPYVISPSEFGENDYETETLYYYEGDGTLVDDDDYPIEDVDGMVGEESLQTFGQYEDDSVFVRNDRLQKDFEILLDSRKFADVTKLNPRSGEDE